MVELLARWRDKLAGGAEAGSSDSTHKKGSREWVDNNNHMVETYSSMGLVMAFYVAMIASFCFPHVVD